jgi:hypothetical protein
MISFVRSLPYALAAIGICSGLALAQAPAGATGTCKDGTSTTAATKSGACAGHGGVKEWFGDQKQGAASSPSSAQKQQAATPPPSSSPSAAAAGSQPKEQTGKARATAAPGGGAGKVWVNTASKVYHCEGDQYYGKTEKGAYMTEAQAKAQGARPANNKACTG